MNLEDGLSQAHGAILRTPKFSILPEFAGPASRGKAMSSFDQKIQGVGHDKNEAGGFEISHNSGGSEDRAQGKGAHIAHENFCRIPIEGKKSQSRAASGKKDDESRGCAQFCGDGG
jgi:hypothetical protein